MGSCFSSATPRDRREILLSMLFPERVVEYLLQHVDSSTKVLNRLNSKFSYDELIEYHDDTTVIFIDIVGFTRMSMGCDPMEIARFLHVVFLQIEHILEDFPSVHKIETIGDCIVLAEGLYAAEKSPEIAYKFALQVIDELSVMPWVINQQRVHVGMHVGRVATGIVGRRMPRFSLFGDPVILASRFLDRAQPNSICCSEEMMQRIQGVVEDVVVKVIKNATIKGIDSNVTLYEISINNS